MVPSPGPATLGLMIGLLLRWLTSAAALWLTSLMFDGIHVGGIVSLLLASLALGALNALVRPLLLLVTLPLTVVTLGCFVFVINALVLKLAAFTVPGFEVVGFWTALFGAIVLSLVHMVLGSFLRDRGKIEYVYVEYREP